MHAQTSNPFRTTTTGEAYQPVRLTYAIQDKHWLIEALNQLRCLQFNKANDHWECWRNQEASQIRLIAEIQQDIQQAPDVVLSILTIKDEQTFLAEFESLERAYFLLPIFYQWFPPQLLQIHHADISNTYFPATGSLPSCTSLFDERQLQSDFIKRQAAASQLLLSSESTTLDLTTLDNLALQVEAFHRHKLPAAERYQLALPGQTPEVDEGQMVIFMYALMLRQTVAHRHWFGEVDYTLGQALHELREHLVAE